MSGRDTVRPTVGQRMPPRATYSAT